MYPSPSKTRRSCFPHSLFEMLIWFPLGKRLDFSVVMADLFIWGGLSLNLFIRDDLGRENEGIKINGNATLILHLKS